MKNVRGGRRGLQAAALIVAGSVAVSGSCSPGEVPDGSGASAEATSVSSMPSLHHVMLNSVDPDAAIEWYLKVWPEASRTEVAGYPAVEGDMYVLFNRVDTPPPGAYWEDLDRAEAQSAFWHIGANTNTTDVRERLAAVGIDHLPLFTSSTDDQGVWRSGLAPYAGIRTEAQIAEAEAAGPQDGGFSYVLGPDGALFEISGGPNTLDSFAHVHFYHEQPLCAANWYVEHLGMDLPPLRDESGAESRRPLYDPCGVETAEPSWPSLESVGTIRGPQGTVAIREREHVGLSPPMCRRALWHRPAARSVTGAGVRPRGLHGRGPGRVVCPTAAGGRDDSGGTAPVRRHACFYDRGPRSARHRAGGGRGCNDGRSNAVVTAGTE